MFNKTLITLAFFNLLVLTGNTTVRPASIDTKDEISMSNQWEDIIEISPYEHLFRSVCEREGRDWRLLCAMAYHESRFQPDVVSHCGARGIMQVMPHVARQFDVSIEQLSDVEENIYVANRVITLIDDMLKLPEGVCADDRMKLTLAAYNCGIGRVNDARRLARSFGEDSTKWEVVSDYLRKMNSPEYYQMSAVKCGQFRGAGQTLAYVDNVTSHYNSYCLLAMR